MRAFVAALGACLALGFVVVSPFFTPARGQEDAEGRYVGAYGLPLAYATSDLGRWRHPSLTGPGSGRFAFDPWENPTSVDPVRLAGAWLLAAAGLALAGGAVMAFGLLAAGALRAAARA